MSQTHAATRAAGPTQAERLVRLRMASLGVVVMLIIQFILGMIYNLYGTAPTSTKAIGLFSSPTIALHVIVGILLGLVAIVQLVRAIGTRHSLSIWLSALGLLSIIGAASPGSGSAAAAPPAHPWACRWRSRPRWPATSRSSSSCPRRPPGPLRRPGLPATGRLPLRDVVGA